MARWRATEGREAGEGERKREESSRIGARAHFVLVWSTLQCVPVHARPLCVRKRSVEIHLDRIL
eukprot:6178003-Pleurochrysis_carterae.AAC.2